MTGVIVGALALMTTVLVVLALRPAASPVVDVAPIEMGAIATTGDTVWRWAGPVDCNADADVVQVERSTNGDAWRSAAIPLSNIYSLSFSDDTHGIATGTTSQCSRGVAITTDGGRTWKYHKDNPVLLDAWWEGNRVFGVERVIGTPIIGEYRVDTKLLLKPVHGLSQNQPCSGADGVPVDIAFWNDQHGVVFCQNTVIDARLLLLTHNGGAAFERVNDESGDFGFAGKDPVTDIDVAGKDRVWALFAPGGGCAEGQLRVSDSQGSTFDTQPCPSDSAPVDDVLDVAFSSAKDGVLLGVQNRQAVVLVTNNGGDTWSARP
jgi:hypothetical protein